MENVDLTYEEYLLHSEMRSDSILSRIVEGDRIKSNGVNLFSDLPADANYPSDDQAKRIVSVLNSRLQRELDAHKNTGNDILSYTKIEFNIRSNKGRSTIIFVYLHALPL